VKRREARLVAGHRVELLIRGEQFFPALEQAIAGARYEVALETYIFRADATGLRIAQALAAAARRGVTVRVVVDGFGSRELPPALPDMLREAGVRWREYRPEFGRFNPSRFNLSRFNPSPLRLRRLHRKLALIDGHTLFVGGINIESDGAPPRHDYALRVHGPLAARARLAMESLWQRTAWMDDAEPWHAPPQVGEPMPGAARAALVLRDNLRHRRDIERAYLRAILGAREEILIACAYFLPGRGLRRALLLAARRGVRVTLLLQAVTDHPLVRHASRAWYGRLLARGVEIYEYTHAEMHAKVAVVDSAWATVGSSNLDPFSLLVAREANVVLRDAALARALRDNLREEIGRHARRCEARDWAARPWHVRLADRLALGLVRVMMSLTGFGRY
jgi:cardiolipin synthase